MRVGGRFFLKKKRAEKERTGEKREKGHSVLAIFAWAILFENRNWGS